MRNLPIIRTVSMALACLGLVAALELARISFGSDVSLEATLPSVCAFFVLGFFYTQLWEYLYHRIPMHRGVRFLSIGENIKRNHNEHHRRFHGDSFQTSDPEMMKHIAGRYWAFPILFLAHYVVLAPVLPTSLLLAFLTAVNLHYVLFESTHWFTHLENNAFDRFVARIPVLSEVRRRQVQHHRWHHEFPDEAFNFMPPYLGDLLTTGKGARAEALPPVALPETAMEVTELESRPDPKPKPASAPAASEPDGRLWQNALLRYGSVAAASVAVIGVAILAHGYFAARGVALKDPTPPTPSELST